MTNESVFMSERRYSEEEVATIFAKAADREEVGRRRVTSGSGLTLSELQEIGREVGISPEAVSHAAGSLDRIAQPTSRMFLGLPLGVGRKIELGRHLTDAEWERLVVDLRETFEARGEVRAHGSLRQWTNGNLQALLEPTGNGDRVRLQTVKGSSQGLMVAGLATLGVGVATFIASVVTGGVVDTAALGSLGSLSAIGLGLFVMGAVPLPAWARLRRRQMDGVVSRLALEPSAPSRQLPPDGE